VVRSELVDQTSLYPVIAVPPLSGAVHEAIIRPDTDPVVCGDVSVSTGARGAVSYVYWIGSLPTSVEPLSWMGLVPGEVAVVPPVAEESTPKKNSLSAPVGDTEIEKFGLLTAVAEEVLGIRSGVESA
jgi:hypothetical protein